MRSTPRADSEPPGSTPATLCAYGELPDGEMELWLLRLNDADDAPLEISILDADERRRADALTRPQDRFGYLAGHLLLRSLLGARLDIPPEAVAYVRRPCVHCGGPHGRPELAHTRRPLHFSLSRSAGAILLAIAPTAVGVDIQALPDQDTIAAVSDLLHPLEREEIRATPSGDRPAAFARVWTRKEAYLKGIGVGVTHDLGAEYTGTDRPELSPRGWTLAEVPVGDGYVAAAAVRGELTLYPPAGRTAPR